MVQRMLRPGSSWRGLGLAAIWLSSLSWVGCSTAAVSPAGAAAGTTAGAGAAGTGPVIDVPYGGAAESGGDSSICADVEVTATRTIPTVALLIEQSNSMDQPLQEGEDLTRWEALKEVLLPSETGVISMFASDVRMGLVLYANPTPYYPPDCPDLTEVMPPALENYDQIAEVYGGALTIPNVPTAESLQAVTARLEAVTEPGPKYILLGTNGDPDSCDEVAGFNKHDDETKALVVSTVQAAFAKGIGTLVVSVGRGPTTRAHLQAVANAGAGLTPDASPGAPFYEPATQEALGDALASAVRGTRTCSFDLRGEVEPASAHRGSVTVDGTKLSMSADDGWRLVTPSQIELVGPACDAFMEGDHELRATFPCDVVVVR
ncbi:MAG TPA: hypothetical protein VEX18_19790 [Polyangiaceae bacterium]|nr:hypothetical protein [Polyangiaceae bacterium]